MGLFLFFKLKLDPSLIQYILTTVSSPSISPSTSPSFSSSIDPLSFYFFSQNSRPSTTKQDKTGCSKTRRKPSYWDWTRAGKRVRDTPEVVVRSPTKPQTNSCNAEDIVMSRPCRLCACLFSHCEPMWSLLSRFSGSCSPGVLQPLWFLQSLIPLSQGFLNSKKRDQMEILPFLSASQRSPSNDNRRRH